jgi:hypothetical protein
LVEGEESHPDLDRPALAHRQVRLCVVVTRFVRRAGLQGQWSQAGFGHTQLSGTSGGSCGVRGLVEVVRAVVSTFEEDHDHLEPGVFDSRATGNQSLRTCEQRTRLGLYLT